VPYLLRFPPSFGIAAGQVRDEVVGHEDLMPTLLAIAGVPIPSSVDGSNLLEKLEKPKTPWRTHLHGEHARCYGEHQSNHYVTDGKEKYIWYSHSGTEQFFDLNSDPTECHNLALSPAHGPQLEKWRARLIKALVGRAEGFTDGTRLIPGRPHEAVLHRNPQPEG
jgi:arylsulfatase A-like enzyme